MDISIVTRYKPWGLDLAKSTILTIAKFVTAHMKDNTKSSVGMASCTLKALMLSLCQHIQALKTPFATTYANKLPAYAQTHASMTGTAHFDDQ